MDVSYGRALAVRGEGRGCLQGAAIAGAIAGSCIAAVPAGLLELFFSSVGLSELVPVLAPPIGWPVRIALALLGAVLVAALMAGSGAVVGNRQPGGKGRTTMGWTQSLGLHHIARLARGETGVTADSVKRAPRLRRSSEDKARDMLARRRADLHPDAPPRAPLSASRDLPQVAELTVVETAPDSLPEPSPRLATPIRDTTDEVRPRPLPRAPEPLSDSDLNWVRNLLDGEETVAPAALVPETLAAILPETVPAAAADASLMTLLDRFEQGVGERIALRDAADAQLRVEDSMAVASELAPAEPAPIEEAPAVQPASDMTMDEALNAALETLRKLSAKANGGR